VLEEFVQKDDVFGNKELVDEIVTDMFEVVDGYDVTIRMPIRLMSDIFKCMSSINNKIVLYLSNKSVDIFTVDDGNVVMSNITVPIGETANMSRMTDNNKKQLIMILFETDVLKILKGDSESVEINIDLTKNKFMVVASRLAISCPIVQVKEFNEIEEIENIKDINVDFKHIISMKFLVLERLRERLKTDTNFYSIEPLVLKDFFKFVEVSLSGSKSKFENMIKINAIENGIICNVVDDLGNNKAEIKMLGSDIIVSEFVHDEVYKLAPVLLSHLKYIVPTSPVDIYMTKGAPILFESGQGSVRLLFIFAQLAGSEE